MAGGCPNGHGAPMILMDQIAKHGLRAATRLPAPVTRRLAGPPTRIDGQKLHPQVQFMLRLAGRAEGDLPSPRRARAEMDRKGDWLAPYPAHPVLVRDITLSGGADQRPARIYRPAAMNGATLLYFHGGGFVAGSLVSHDRLCRALADAAGCTVVALDYRLAPEHPFPAAVDDAVAACRGLVEAADGLGIDPGRIAVGGDSAGGNLAAVAAQQCRHDHHPPIFQFLWAPWLDLARKRPSRSLFRAGYFLEDAALDEYQRHYAAGAVNLGDPRLSPIYGDLTGLCPAAIITAGFDPLRDDGADYAKALRAAGVPVDYHCASDVAHIFPNVAGYIAPARAAFRQSVVMLRRGLDSMLTRGHPT